MRSFRRYLSPILLFPFSTSILVQASNDDLCMLCPLGVDEMLWPLTVIETDGLMCSTLFVDMAFGMAPNDGNCQSNIARHRDTCCGTEPPESLNITMPERPEEPYVGPYNRCGVCYTGDYPSVTSMVLNVLYIGYGSCAMFEKVGQQGRIPDYLCSTIQSFAHEPCGCGRFNVNLNSRSGTSNQGGTGDSSEQAGNETAGDAGGDGRRYLKGTR